MKRNQLLIVSVLVFGLQGAGLGNALAYPADAEWTFELAAVESYADRHARLGTPEVWGVSERGVQPHDPFPFGGGVIDD